MPALRHRRVDRELPRRHDRADPEPHGHQVLDPDLPHRRHRLVDRPVQPLASTRGLASSGSSRPTGSSSASRALVDQDHRRRRPHRLGHRGDAEDRVPPHPRRAEILPPLRDHVHRLAARHQRHQPRRHAVHVPLQRPLQRRQRVLVQPRHRRLPRFPPHPATPGAPRAAPHALLTARPRRRRGSARFSRMSAHPSRRIAPPRRRRARPRRPRRGADPPPRRPPAPWSASADAARGLDQLHALVIVHRGEIAARRGLPRPGGHPPGQREVGRRRASSPP